MTRTRTRSASATASSRTMTAVAQDRYGGPEVLRPERAPVPEVRAGEVLVRAAAVSVTQADIALRSGSPWFARLFAGPVRPRIRVIGGVVAGVVDVVGAGVKAPRPGDRVVGSTMAGACAELVRLRAEDLVPVPDGMADVDAVAVVEGGLTALPFLRDHGTVGPGSRVLVHGAASAVGVSAVQLAVHLGAEVTGVVGPTGLELVRSLGAAHVVDRSREDFTRLGERYDVLLDAVGKSSFRRCRPILARGGVYLTTVPSAAILGQSLWRRWSRTARAGIAFTGLRPRAAQRADTAELLRLAAGGRVRAVVDRTYRLTAAADAHAYVGSHRKPGAVVLLP